MLGHSLSHNEWSAMSKSANSNNALKSGSQIDNKTDIVWLTSHMYEMDIDASK